MVPARVSMASEQFSGLIDFLLPRARTDYADLDTASMLRYLAAYHQADVLADTWVSYLREHRHHGRELFEQALNAGIDSVADAPAELTACCAAWMNCPPALTWPGSTRARAASGGSARSRSQGSAWRGAFTSARSCPGPPARSRPAPAPSSNRPAACPRRRDSCSARSRLAVTPGSPTAARTPPACA